MNTATIDLTALKAALFATSTEQTRYYLNGVLVEIGAQTVTYVATDGHILFAYRAAWLEGDSNTLIGNFIIPSEVIKGIKLKKFLTSATLSMNSDTGYLSLALPDQTALSFRPIDGTFPNWRRVLPETTNGVLSADCQFDPNLMLRLWKAGEVMGWKAPAIAYNGNGPALLTFGHDTGPIGVIMPRTNKGTAAPLPTWAQFREYEKALAA